MYQKSFPKKINEIELKYINSVAKNNAKTKKDGLDLISLEDKMYVVENGIVVSKGFHLLEDGMLCVPERKEYLQIMDDGEISLNVEYDISCLAKWNNLPDCFLFKRIFSILFLTIKNIYQERN